MADPSTPSPLYLGIDTGGTYTDGVLFDPLTRAVLQTVKVLTTHYDLKICIAQVLDRLTPPDANQIACVALSTTLATNSIAEGKRKPVALLLLGYDQELVYQYDFHKQFSTPNYFFIDGRHNLDGVEEHPLDEAVIQRVALEIAGAIGSFAVSAYAGPMNASHEERAAEIIEKATGKQVVQAHHLSSELDSIRRATTASLNAALLSDMQNFITAVQEMLAQKGYHCPTMVVRGDGSLVSTAYARHRPVEIVHSGPATSTIGGHYLAGVADALVIDMGGTTTDIALVEQGRVQIQPKAATVGDFRTCVKTIKTRSFGLGGDSQIRFDHLQNLAIGPERIQPLAYLFAQHPDLKAGFLRQLQQRSGLRYWDEVEYWSLLQEPAQSQLDSRTGKIVDLLKEGPQSLSTIRKKIGPLAPIFIQGLVNQAIILRTGLTPTDLLHVNGEFTPWDCEVAAAVTELAARNWRESAPGFIARVKHAISKRIVAEIVQFITGKSLTEANGLSNLTTDLDRWLFDESIQPSDVHLGSQLFLKVPIVGIGAPARAFLPEVARMLGTQIIIPEHFAVANAIGAVVGNIAVQGSAEVYPSVSGTSISGYYARVDSTQRLFLKFEEAVEYARAQLTELVRAEASAAGAASIVLETKEQIIWDGMVNFTAWAIGKPSLY